ncbi:sensor histidine kinase [Tabrizicola sp.]|uniref:sensor histidine kinase n=1 Tax=Tabrizicola sp. TaxID=2005166 RepID=UPI003F35A6CB
MFGNRRRMVIVSLIGLAALALVAAVDRLSARFYLSEGEARAETALQLTVNALDGYLKRYETLPGVLAEDPRVRGLFAVDAGAVDRLAMSRWMKWANTALEASDIYVMDRDGNTIAASNFDLTDSFMGKNFAYRPYFTEALAGGTGRFFAIGTTSGIRGYFFGAPVRDAAGDVAGVIAVKIGVDAIESSWNSAEHEIIVTDPAGIVFMSSDPGWLYKATLPLTPERQAETEDSRRYAEMPIGVLYQSRDDAFGVPLIALTTQDGAGREYLEASETMAGAGWTVHVLLDTAYLRGQARLATAAFVLALGVGLLIGLLVFQGRRRMAERIAMQAGAQAELEHRVEERTADLARVNRLIEAEIAERRETEQELRRTQADLVQAGKLAALGQMSAALSHEINQPLAAARNFADSAAIFIERGDPVRAKENVREIVSLIDRMAAIGRHLRNVARKPNQALSEIALGPVVTDALRIAEARLAAAGVAVETDIPADLPAVIGGAVRLQQVLVNILSNAADAVEGAADRRITLGAVEEDGKVVIRIRDHGPGVPAAIADRIFDPFFTTKQVGSGLGLGLSISYNIVKDFGGDLRVANHPEGGAVFTVELRAARSDRMAAE